jgi:hypothetical protein
MRLFIVLGLWGPGCASDGTDRMGQDAVEKDEGSGSGSAAGTGAGAGALQCGYNDLGIAEGGTGRAAVSYDEVLCIGTNLTGIAQFYDDCSSPAQQEGDSAARSTAMGIATAVCQANVDTALAPSCPTGCAWRESNEPTCFVDVDGTTMDSSVALEELHEPCESGPGSLVLATCTRSFTSDAYCDEYLVVSCID